MQEERGEIIKIPNITPVRQRLWWKPVMAAVGIMAFGAFAFGLGRLSRIEETKPDLVVETLQTAQTPQTNTQPLTSDASPTGQGRYVASKNGSKYYLPTCSGAKRISDANKVWFDTKEQVQARGLTPATNCPGL